MKKTEEISCDLIVIGAGMAGMAAAASASHLGLKTVQAGSSSGLLFYSGMLDMYSDFTIIQSQTGMHVELLEMCDLDEHFEQVTDEEIEKKLEEIYKFFIISGDSPSDPIAKKPTEDQMQ